MIIINFSKFYNDAFIPEDLEYVNISSKKVWDKCLKETRKTKLNYLPFMPDPRSNSLNQACMNFEYKLWLLPASDRDIPPWYLKALIYITFLASSVVMIVDLFSQQKIISHSIW